MRIVIQEILYFMAQAERLVVDRDITMHVLLGAFAARPCEPPTSG